MNSLPFSFQLFSSALGGSATPRGLSSSGIEFFSSSAGDIDSGEEASMEGLSSVEDALVLDTRVGAGGDVAPGWPLGFGCVELLRVKLG